MGSIELNKTNSHFIITSMTDWEDAHTFWKLKELYRRYVTPTHTNTFILMLAHLPLHTEHFKENVHSACVS